MQAYRVTHDLRREDRTLEALDRGLVRLGELDPRMLRLVELRFFGGQTMPDSAEMLGMSLRTAEREWQTARAWLRKHLGEKP